MMISILDVEQGTPEWLLARAGMPTASCFDTVMAKGRGGADSKTRLDYLHQLADEVIYQDPVESYTNPSMERGKAWEAEARDIYALENDVLPERVGFVRNDDIGAGCSPDSLLGTKGMLEIKTMYPRLFMPHVIKGDYPPGFKPQIQGGLWVAGREWCDLIIYWPKRRPYITRIYRDEAYLTILALAVAQFNTELAAIVAAYRTKVDLKGTLEAAAAQ